MFPSQVFAFSSDTSFAPLSDQAITRQPKVCIMQNTYAQEEYETYVQAQQELQQSSTPKLIPEVLYKLLRHHPQFDYLDYGRMMLKITKINPLPNEPLPEFFNRLHLHQIKVLRSFFDRATDNDIVMFDFDGCLINETDKNKWFIPNNPHFLNYFLEMRSRLQNVFVLTRGYSFLQYGWMQILDPQKQIDLLAFNPPVIEDRYYQFSTEASHGLAWAKSSVHQAQPDGATFYRICETRHLYAPGIGGKCVKGLDIFPDRGVFYTGEVLYRHAPRDPYEIEVNIFNKLILGSIESLRCNDKIAQLKQACAHLKETDFYQNLLHYMHNAPSKGYYLEYIIRILEKGAFKDKPIETIYFVDDQIENCQAFFWYAMLLKENGLIKNCIVLYLE